MRLTKLAAIAVFSWIVAVPAAHGQFPQYTNPGSGALVQPEVKPTLEKAMGDALWRFGDVRLQPILGLRNIGYVSNISGKPGDKVDDYTATGVVGVKAYLPIGKKVIFAAHALPEYAWWKSTTTLRTWQYRYGAGLFGYFNRLTVEAKFTADDQQSYLSNELESPANITNDKGELNFAVRVSGPFSVFFGGSQEKAKYQDNGLRAFFPASVDLLNRTETVARGGILYKRANGFAVGLGYERDNTDFTRTARDRSNSGGGPLLTVQHSGSRWTASIDASYRTLREKTGASFREFKALSGSGTIGLKTGGRTQVNIYGSKGLFYTLAAGTDYADEQRLGISGQMLVGWRTDLRVYYESGQAKYRSAVDVLDSRRTDDFDTVGLEAQFKVGESATFRLGYNETQFNSNQSQFDRKLKNIQVSLNFGGVATAW